MEFSILEYEKLCDLAIDRYKNVLYQLNNSLQSDPEPDNDLSNIDYNDLINTVESNLQYLNKNKCIYKFQKLSREEFNNILQNAIEFQTNSYLTLYKNYKIKDNDTLNSICNDNNLTQDELLSTNNINSKDFDILKENNSTILIPYHLNYNEIQSLNNLMVFGSVSDINAWGIDLSNELKSNNNDLYYLNNENTLVQSIENKFGEYGAIPGYENCTINLNWTHSNNDPTNYYDKDMTDAVNIIKLQNIIASDPRIDKIIDIRIDDVDNGTLITIDLEPIHKNKAKVQIIKEFFNAG